MVEEKIKNISGIQRKLHLTKILKDIKDTQLLKKQSLKPIQLLKKNLEPGQIVLLHKRKDTTIGTTLLKYYHKKGPARFTHVMLVSDKNSE